MVRDFAERYQSELVLPIADRQIEISRYLPIKNLCIGSRILDLGCGRGFSTNLLRKWGAVSVVGIDSDLDSITYANKEYGEPGISFIHGYAEQISEIVRLEEFDGICFVECLEHVIEPSLVLMALDAALRTHAWIYITAPNDYWSYRYEENDNPHHLRKFTKSEFLEITCEHLGNPNETGEAHGFLGFTTIPDQMDSNFEGNDQTLAIINTEESMNTEESVFYYAFWGKKPIGQTTVGSKVPMDSYTKINDADKLHLNVAELSQFAEKELAFKLQNTTEALVEAQNKLRAVRLLMDSLELQNSKFPHSSINFLTPKVSKLDKFMTSPPMVVVKIYQLFPNSFRNSLRIIRRRILR